MYTEVQFMSLMYSSYQSRKAQALTTENYQFTKKNSHLLHQPRFTIKFIKPLVKDLTYRKVNDWDTKNLISGQRENKEAGWRKYSILEIITFQIISDLKEIGFRNDKIGRIIKKLTKGSIIIGHRFEKPPLEHKFLDFEYFFFSSQQGIKNLLLIDNSDNFFFLTERNAMHDIAFSKGSSFPLVILPFHDYVRKIIATKQKDIKTIIDSTLKGILKDIPTKKEQELLNIIQEGKYEEILIKKDDGEEFLIKAKTRKSGDFTKNDVLDLITEKDYQKVTVINNKGKIVTLIQEESIKV